MPSVFSRIMNREIPGHFVHEDEQCVVIMTIQPFTQGHVLVIPREEIDCWEDVPAPLAQHLLTVSQRMAKVIKSEFSALRAGVLIAGVDIDHLHIHIFPANDASDFEFGKSTPQAASSEQLADVAARLREALANSGR